MMSDPAYTRSWDRLWAYQRLQADIETMLLEHLTSLGTAWGPHLPPGAVDVSILRGPGPRRPSLPRLNIIVVHVAPGGTADMMALLARRVSNLVHRRFDGYLRGPAEITITEESPDRYASLILSIPLVP
jgi:hypothetical protein